MAEFYGGVLFIVEAGEGAHLAVVADEDADVGLVGHNMSELVEQIGEHLSAPARGPRRERPMTMTPAARRRRRPGPAVHPHRGTQPVRRRLPSTW